MEPTQQIPVLKADAKIMLELGSEYIGRIQAILFYLFDGEPESFSVDLKAKIAGNKELNPKESSIVTLSTIMQHIMQQAQSKGLIEMKDVADVIS